MQTLVSCRQQPEVVRLREIRQKYSMLHEDVLLLVHHFGKTAPGHILEIGAFLGGSTIAAALGARDADERKTIVTVESGGALKHPRLPSRNILRDLKKNLIKQGVAAEVAIVAGYSGQHETVATVHERLQAGSVGLFIFDADAGIDRDLRLYGDLLTENAWVVVDDYFRPQENEKAVRIQPRIDALVAAGELRPLGVYGWGTWIGRRA